MKIKNVIGSTYGLLTAIKEIEGRKTRTFVCKCLCGRLADVTLSNLRSGNTTSCGCYQREIAKQANTIHGKSGRGDRRSRVYVIWMNMIQRCTNEQSTSWPRYGGLGITVCDRWMKFENFLFDMGEPPAKHSIDRKNNTGSYCLENCVWASNKQQARNKRNNVFVTYKGQTKTIAEWAEITGIKYHTLLARIQRYGWGIEKALQSVG